MQRQAGALKFKSKSNNNMRLIVGFVSLFFTIGPVAKVLAQLAVKLFPAV